MNPLIVIYKGKKYTVKDIRRLTRASPSQACYRMNQYTRGEIPARELFKAVRSKYQTRASRVPVTERTTREQKNQLAEFRRLTANDDRVFFKYFAS